MPERRPKISDAVREEYTRAFADINNVGKTVEEVQRIVKERFRILDWKKPPGIDWVYKFKRENFPGDLKTLAWLDMSWSIGALAEHSELDASALPDLLDISAECLINRWEFTNRHAIWVGRLRSAVDQEDSGDDTRLGRLFGMVAEYANLERISELTQTPFNTGPLDGYMSLVVAGTQTGSYEHYQMKDDTFDLAISLGLLPSEISLPVKRVEDSSDVIAPEYPSLAQPYWFLAKADRRSNTCNQDEDIGLRSLLEGLSLSSGYWELTPSSERFLELSIKFLVKNHAGWQVPTSIINSYREADGPSKEFRDWIENKRERISHFSILLRSENYQALYDDPLFLNREDLRARQSRQANV